MSKLQKRFASELAKEKLRQRIVNQEQRFHDAMFLYPDEELQEQRKRDQIKREKEKGKYDIRNGPRQPYHYLH